VYIGQGLILLLMLKGFFLTVSVLNFNKFYASFHNGQRFTLLKSLDRLASAFVINNFLTDLFREHPGL
jgi:uncharacterized membrane protein